jgi:hypothetical protein
MFVVAMLDVSSVRKTTSVTTAAIMTTVGTP